MAQTMISPEGNDHSKVRTIGMVAFDGVELIDLTGPLDVFAMANEGFRRAGITDGPAYKLTVIAKRQGLVTTSSGLQVNADTAYENVSDGIDTLMIPGSPSVSMVLADPELRDWVRFMSTRARRIVSVCTGAFLLADAGLLDGRRATTHWAYCDKLAAEYPSITSVESDRIFVCDDHISTSGGITSGIDLALSLLEEDWGREMALGTAQYMVMFLKRPGGQSQFSAFLVSEATNDPDIRALQVWIMENSAEDLRIEVLAERMAMSPRNFARVFRAETGMPPAKFVEKVRVDCARQLLGESNQRIETVAVDVGFRDYERMRRAFVRNLGISPLEFRARFTRQGPQPAPVMTPTRADALFESVNQS
jgi:transcriptional regulator GlxA family with amidase domain